MLIYAIVSMCLALTFYSIGVWSEKWQGTLKKWHLFVFWMGFIFDTVGTSIMSEIAKGGFQFDFHGITGLLAIILMFFHSIWATVVLVKNYESMKTNFHKFSIIVWLIWLIPFVSGAMFAMAK
ncbi:MAG TPA: HsmA family protein [Clostridia bacterium]|nr:HsmA family protein [Clostridia bacterium]